MNNLSRAKRDHIRMISFLWGGQLICHSQGAKHVNSVARTDQTDTQRNDYRLNPGGSNESPNRSSHINGSSLPPCSISNLKEDRRNWMESGLHLWRRGFWIRRDHWTSKVKIWQLNSNGNVLSMQLIRIRDHFCGKCVLGWRQRCASQLSLTGTECVHNAFLQTDTAVCVPNKRKSKNTTLEVRGYMLVVSAGVCKNN